MTASGRWVIGRSPDCDIVISVQEVSSQHCCLTRTDADGWVLEDLGSSNGTFVNGTRLAANKRVRVRPEDQVTLGQTTPLPWPDSRPAVAKTAGSARPPALPAATRPEAPAPGARILRVGRAPDNDLIFDQPSVSAYHARVIIQGGRATIEDAGSSNGTFVGRPDNRVTRAPLNADDVVYLGSLRVPAARLLGQQAQVRQTALAVQIAPSRSVLLGRAADCDQVLDSPMVSAHHARLSRQGGGFELEDLGSTNGTFVNGARVTRASVKPGDVVTVGSFRFTVAPDGDLRRQDLRGNTTLEARNLGVRAGGKTLIADVNLTIFPGEFVGLMGPSGAGKSTLMNAMNGYSPPAQGSVLISGQDLYRSYDQFRSALGYVPQEDVMHRTLTVRQALYYCARLRLPADFSQSDIDDRIRSVIDQLSLQGTEEVLVGSTSGGQKRRVALAMELMTDPEILYLDEPTSGLSSEDTLTVMKVLRKLADGGKTILLTIHQPSLEVYRLMDHLVLMGKDAGSKEPGRLVYFGPAYPDAVHHFNPEGLPDLKPGAEPSPDEVLRGLKKKPSPEWVQRYQKSQHYQRFVRERVGSHLDSGGDSHKQRRALSPLHQWWMLTRRLVTIKLRDRMNTAILLVQAPIVAILIVMVFGKQMTLAESDDNWPKIAGSLGTSLFLMALAALWFGASNAVREIVGEWAIYHRERMVSLRIGPYVASKLTMLGLLALFQCLTLLILVDVCCGLKSNKVVLLALLMLSAMVGSAIGLVLSALARTNEVAIALLPLVLIPMVILGGAIQPVHDMHVAPRIISYIIPTRWGYEGMLLQESAKRPMYNPPVVPTKDDPNPKKKADIDMAEQSFQKDKHRTSAAAAALVLFAMLALGVGAVALILRLRDVH